MHGAHQVAQKLMSSTWPWKSLTTFSLPSASRNATGGAGVTRWFSIKFCIAPVSGGIFSAPLIKNAIKALNIIQAAKTDLR